MALQLPSFPVGHPPEVGAVADWCEFAALARTPSFKRGDLKASLSQEGHDDADLIEESVWHELLSRSRLFADRWPLRLVGNRLTRRSPCPVPIALYRFLCLLGLGAVDAVDRTTFEVLVAELLTAFTDQAGLHVGAPASEGMDPSFRERVKAYIAQSGLLTTEVKAAPLPADKDLGVDAISWWPFGDDRGASLHFLAQCATGGDWEEKLNDIDLEVWKDHIHWGVPPVRVFAVPFVISLAEAKWVRTSRRGGLILDRPRLVEIATWVDLSPVLIRALGSRVRELGAA